MSLQDDCTAVGTESRMSRVELQGTGVEYGIGAARNWNMERTGSLKGCSLSELIHANMVQSN